MRWWLTGLALLSVPLLLCAGCGDGPEPTLYPNNLELRGVWLTPDWDTVDWDRTMDYLEGYGINAVFVYMHSAGGSYYPSEVLPWATDADRTRDNLEQCSRAAAER